jgi:hypothetical protein
VVADEHVGAHAHHLPPDQQHEQVVGRDDEAHGGGEDADERRVRRVARIAAQVGHRVDLDEERHHGREHQHGGAELIDPQGDRDRDSAGVDLTGAGDVGLGAEPPVLSADDEREQRCHRRSGHPDHRGESVVAVPDDE